MKVRYLTNVTSPPGRVGVINEIRSFNCRIGRQMVNDGSVTTDLDIPKSTPQFDGENLTIQIPTPRVEPRRDIVLQMDITAPAEQAGKKGDVKNIRNKIADQLVTAGYAKEIETKKQEKSKDGSINKRKNPKSR